MMIKKLRGAMARFIIEKQVKKLDKLKILILLAFHTKILIQKITLSFTIK